MTKRGQMTRQDGPDGMTNLIQMNRQRVSTFQMIRHGDSDDTTKRFQVTRQDGADDTTKRLRGSR